jgi:hypothetical protein
MALDPTIPLSFKAPEVASPIVSISQLMQVRGLSSEIALRNAQADQAQQNTQNIAAETQAKNMDLHDANYLQKAGLDPATHAQLAVGDTSGVSGHVQLKTEQAIQANALKVQQDKATLTTTDLANRNTASKTIADSVAGLQGMTKPDGTLDFDRINASLPSTITALTPAIKTLGLDPAKFASQQISSPDQLQGLASAMNAETAVNDKVLAQKKTAAETAASTATTNETNQKVNLLTRKIAATDAMSQPGGLEQMVNGRIPAQFAQFRADALSAAQNAGKLNPGDPGKVAEAIEKVAAQADEIQKKADPTNIRAAGATAASEAAATSGIKTQTDINTAVGVRKAEAAQAPAPLQHILDPAIRTQISGDQAKASDEYQQKTGDAQRLQLFIDGARSGNEAAAKMVSLGEVREIVNRVNQTELKNAGVGMSIGRQLSDLYNTNANGRPSDATLSDIEKVGKSMLASGKTIYQGKIQNLNNQGAQYSLEPAAGPAAPAAPKAIALKNGGSVTPHSAADEARFRKDHADAIK